MSKLAIIILIIATSNSSISHSKVPSSAFELGGYLMLDHDYYGPFFDKTSTNYQNSTEIRRSKLSLSYKPNSIFKTKLQIKYDKEIDKKGELSLGDAWIRLSHKNKTSLQFGRMKQPFGLEQLTSSSQLVAIERSLPTIAFSLGRDFGLQLHKKRKHYSWAAGYFINRDTEHDFALSNFDLMTLNKPDNGQATHDIESATARIHFNDNINSFDTSYQPIIHIGSSISKQWLDGKKHQFKEKAEINSSDNIIRSARFYARSKINYQLDIAWIESKSLIQGEIFSTQMKAIDNTHWHYTGGYLQFSYLKSANYQYKHGRIKRSMKQGYSLELVFRQSYLDLRDHAIGSESAITLLGMNLYLGTNIKLMLNISNPWISGDTVSNDHSGQAYSFRAQLDY